MKLKARNQSRQEERCAVCRDGPEGLVVCRGCGTLLHASCLIDVKGCPSIGCNEKDPLQEPSGFSICVIHTPNLVSEDAKRDLRELWGRDHCTCEEPEPRFGPYGTVRGGSAGAVNAAISAQTKEFDDLVRAETGPQKEPGCVHRFASVDHKCVYCHASEGEVYDHLNEVGALAFGQEKVKCASLRCGEPTTRQLVYCSLCRADEEIYGTRYSPRKFLNDDCLNAKALLAALARETEEHGAEAVMDSFGVTCGEQRGVGLKPWGWKDYTFWASMILPPLLVGLYQLIWG